MDATVPQSRVNVLIMPRLAATIVASLIIVAVGAPHYRARAADPLSRFTTRDAMLESYTVPVHIDVHLRKLFRFHFGMHYFKRPDHLALDVHAVPPNGRRLFSQIGAPITWAETYAMRLTSATNDGTHTTYQLEGVPKHAGGDIDHFIVETDEDPSAPLHAQWFCRDGTTITTTIDEQPAGQYWLPKRTTAISPSRATGSRPSSKWELHGEWGGPRFGLFWRVAAGLMRNRAATAGGLDPSGEAIVLAPAQ